MGPLAIQCDGKIVVAGDLSNGADKDFAVARYTDAGALDTTFDGDGVVQTDLGDADDAREVRVQDDGKIIVGGFGRDVSGINNYVLVRYNPDGTLDSGFADNGVGLYERGGNSHEATPWISITGMLTWPGRSITMALYSTSGQVGQWSAVGR